MIDNAVQNLSFDTIVTELNVEKTHETNEAELETSTNTSYFECTSSSDCISCGRLKKKIKSLQKTISWLKKTKGTLRKKLSSLEAKHEVVFDAPAVSQAITSSDNCMDEESEVEDLDDASSMDYSSYEESNQGDDLCGDTTKNTIR